MTSLSGCHPHQWLPRRLEQVWRCKGLSGSVGVCHFVGELVGVESFITHNGDLDFFNFNGTKYGLSDVQCVLERLMGHPMPSDVDSAAIAGLLDLLRTQGLWAASVRYGYLFGALATASKFGGDRIEQLAKPEMLAGLVDMCTQEWQALLGEVEKPGGAVAAQLVKANVTSEGELLGWYHGMILERLLRRLESGKGPFPADVEAFRAFEGFPLPGVPDHRQVANRRLIETCCAAFIYGDLLRAALELMAGAEGSFGLVLSHSLDAEKDVVLAARGQTMSVAFYPSLGCITFGSESAATKVCMGATSDTENSKVDGSVDEAVKQPLSFRFDLDDVAGEVVLLRCGVVTRGSSSALGRSAAGSIPGTRHLICCAGTEREAVEVLSLGGQRQQTISGQDNGLSTDENRTLLVVNILQHGEPQSMWHRRLRLDGNPLLSAPPDVLCADPVGRDLLDTPHIVQKITTDFDSRDGHSLNRITAWTFTSKLRERLRQHRAGTHDGSVDLLITGCEVSLWTGEQFGSDLQLIYPKLKIEVISANKLLGELGQTTPIPQPGFRFNSETHNLNRTIVLILSHSGGTHGALACCSLLSGYTSNIFVVTSELDTHLARAVRLFTRPMKDEDSEAASFVDLSSQHVFSTHTGFRPAEPCSVSIIAMHHLLSMLLIFLMGFLGHFEHRGPSGTHTSICGSAFHFNEVRELAMIARKQHDAATELVGRVALGDTRTANELEKQGRRWAQHILEAPLSWILSLSYIAVTVLLGVTPLGAIVSAAIGQPLPVPQLVPTVSVNKLIPAWVWAVRYIVAIVDVGLYAFLGWWTTVLIRLLQRRPWLHRVAGRSVLIGDVPWVSQCAEAFASKLFALTYSISSCTFASANPADHLVHRHTHRVVRGSLLVIGRPDGRLNALTTAEAACTLAFNQASSIQNYGVTCESVTIGHSSYRLPLSAAHVQLPTLREPFTCEVLRQHVDDDDSKTLKGTDITLAHRMSMSDVSHRSGRGSSSPLHEPNIALAHRLPETGRRSGGRSSPSRSSQRCSSRQSTVLPGGRPGDELYDQGTASRDRISPHASNRSSVHRPSIPSHLASSTHMPSRMARRASHEAVSSIRTSSRDMSGLREHPILRAARRSREGLDACGARRSPEARGSREGRGSKEAFVSHVAMLDQLSNNAPRGTARRPSVSVFEGFIGDAPTVESTTDNGTHLQAGLRALPPSDVGHVETRDLDVEMGQTLTGPRSPRPGSPPPSPPSAPRPGRLALRATPSSTLPSGARSRRALPGSLPPSYQSSDEQSSDETLLKMTHPKMPHPKMSLPTMPHPKMTLPTMPHPKMTLPTMPHLNLTVHGPPASSDPSSKDSSKMSQAEPSGSTQQKRRRSVDGLRPMLDGKGDDSSITAMSPNELKASLITFEKRSRRIFEREAASFNSASLTAFKNLVFELDPIAEPFLGAWMIQSDEYKECSTTELMQQQQLLQKLADSRFDAMQRLLSFFVLFHR